MAISLPRVDVVVVNFNSGLYLRRCLVSVLRSDKPVNVIVVDNASGDESIDLVRDLDVGQHQLQFVLNQDNVGFSAAVNIGAKQSNGAHLLLLNPDCEVHAHTISKLSVVLDDAPGAGIVGALVFNEDGTEQRGCRRLEPTLSRSIVTALRQDHRYEGVNLSHQPMPDEPVVVDAVSGAALMIQRSCYQSVGGMDEGYFLHVEDLDICRKVRNSGLNVLFVPTVSVFHHQGVSSRRVPVRTEWHKHCGMLRYYAKFQQAEESIFANTVYVAMVLINLVVTLLRKTVGLLKPALAQQDLPLELTHLMQKQLSVVTGARSDLGTAILQQFGIDQPQETVIAVSRAKISCSLRVGNEIWFNWRFFEKAPVEDFGHIHQVVLASPIWSAELLAKQLQRFGGIARLIAMSSTSIQAKANTKDGSEKVVVRSLQSGEDSLLAWAKQEQVRTTILRPSMIYGGLRNQNIGFIRRLLPLVRFFPLVGAGLAKRQPVHVEDLAVACGALLKQKKRLQMTYSVAGGEVVSYRQMVEAIFLSLRLKPRFIQVDESRLRLLVRLVNWVPGLRFLKPEMITRSSHDLTYDHSAAERDFNYAPGPFRP